MGDHGHSLRPEWWLVWSRRLGSTRFRALQVSARGGVLLAELAGDRVRRGGQAITVLRGDLLA